MIITSIGIKAWNTSCCPRRNKQEILFDDIQNRIIDEIQKTKFSIWIAMAWFTTKIYLMNY